MFQRPVLILLFLSIVFLAVNGCGGGSGGGRYTLPGENPVGIPTTTPTPTATTTPTPTPTTTPIDPVKGISSAWDDYKAGNYSSAIAKYNALLAQTNLTSAQRLEAYNGLGWAQAKSSNLEAAANSFSQASTGNDEGKIGMAAVYIQRGQKANMISAINLLESVGFKDPAFRFTAPHPISVSNAEAHAMLAFAYFWRNDASQNDSANAQTQINAARAEDSSPYSSVGQIYQIISNSALSP